MKISKIKKIVALLLCAVLMCSVLPSTGAAVVPEDSTVQPMYKYTASATTNLVISGTTAYCKAALIGYSGTTTKVSIAMTLQKKSWLTWNDVETWKITTNSYQTSFSKSRTIDSGTYRVKVVYVAYSGTASETFTRYSGSSSC